MKIIDIENCILEQLPTCTICSSRLRNGMKCKDICGYSSSTDDRNKKSA